MNSATALPSFAGQLHVGVDGSLQRIALPRRPETLGVRPNVEIEAWMWYFAGWEPEYTWDSWDILSRNAPERLPLLADPIVIHGQQSYYVASHPDVLEWHVRWMREAGVSTVLFQFIAEHGPRGKFTGPYFTSRTLEIPFLGKATLGGRPTAVGPYAEAIDFAVMWTNFLTPSGRPEVASPGVRDYLITHYLSHPNYKRLDGRAVVFIWDLELLATECGSRRAARAYLDALRGQAKRAGVGELLLLGVYSAADPDLIADVGADGCSAYVYHASGGSQARTRKLTDGRRITDVHEDYPTQTRPGYVRQWERSAKALRQRGQTYLVPVCPMQDRRPLDRESESLVWDRSSPAEFGLQLKQARTMIREQGLRPIVVVEAWNEWGEGSYMEPSMEFGFAWLESLRAGLSPSIGEEGGP